MSREDPQMKIRLPAELKARIEEASSANNRTMNAEILARLYQSFDTRDTELAQGTVSAVLKTLTMAITHAERLAKRLEVIEKRRS